MSALALAPVSALVAPNKRATFVASGGTAPYVFSVSTNNSGGSIDANGQYLAGPAGLVTDTVTVTDAALDTVTASVTVTAGLYQQTQRNIVPPRFKFPNSQTIEGVYGAEKDTEAERARAQGILPNLPGTAPPDALPIIAAERQLRRASSDTDTSFGEYLRTAWDTQYRSGLHRRVLEELDRAGFPMGDPDGAHVMQRYKRYSWLTASGGLFTEGTHPVWTFDGAPLTLNTQWGLVFGADVVGLSDGTPSAETLNDICDRLGPQKVRVRGDVDHRQRPVVGFSHRRRVGRLGGDPGRRQHAIRSTNNDLKGETRCHRITPETKQRLRAPRHHRGLMLLRLSYGPSDGDADNAASVAQAFKVLADFIAWLVAPFANIANQAQRIWAVQCARLLARGGFDHRGFPAGNLLRWSEDWNDIGAVTKTTGSGGWFGRWRWSTNAIAGSSTVDVGVPTGSAHVALWLKLSGGSGPGCAVVEMYRGQQATSGGGIDYVLEFLLRFDTINGDPSPAAGIFDGTLVGLAPTSPFESINPKGIGLYFPQGGTNLLFYSNLSGTPASPIDTGVAAVINTTYRVRLEMQSPATSDNTASRCSSATSTARSSQTSRLAACRTSRSRRPFSPMPRRDRRA